MGFAWTGTVSPQTIMMTNEQIARRFADQFDPPLNVVRTQRVNGRQVSDAWQIAHWDQARSIGITAVVYSGKLHAYLEASGNGDMAEDAGRVISYALNGMPVGVQHGSS